MYFLIFVIDRARSRLYIEGAHARAYVYNAFFLPPPFTTNHKHLVPSYSDERSKIIGPVTTFNVYAAATRTVGYLVGYQSLPHQPTKKDDGTPW